MFDADHSDLTTDEYFELLLDKAKKAPPTNEVVEHDRISGNLSLYFQEPGEPPLQESIVFNRELTSNGSCVYHRKLKLHSKDEPTKLERGWVESGGFLLIRNRTGEKYQVIPTPEEKQRDKDSLVRLHTKESVFDIPAGMFFCAVVPSDFEATLECVYHSAVVTIHACSSVR